MSATRPPGPASTEILLVAAAVVVQDGRVLLARRNAGSHLAGFWEFPGGKLEPGEDPAGALRRELREELGVESSVGPPFAFNYHDYGGQRVLLLTYQVTLQGEPRALGCEELRWFTPDQIPSLATPEADVPIFERLLGLIS